MRYPLVKPIYKIFDDECDDDCNNHYLQEMELFLNEEFDNEIPRKFFFFKQYILVYKLSNTIVIDFPEKMQIPKDIRDYLSDDNFYYTVFFKYSFGRRKIFIKKCKKGGCLYESNRKIRHV